MTLTSVLEKSCLEHIIVLFEEGILNLVCGYSSGLPCVKHSFRDLEPWPQV